MQQETLFSGQSLTENNPKVLLEMKTRALGCTGCKLHNTRTHVVWGEGNSQQPKVALIGEAPGATEDTEGRPFVGRAG